ncbi:coenzyme F420-0:L-glutamate ligase [uncultured Megasphaera sp.]|uniref:coenzyme F420-0:L-glutamate ligase n=1 Tax=uncultured Megasphaera sp. TaxID=165188 RepID=UPI00265A7BD4|nr:coenzyme F420-0:L-glutamate ligase [uncultured Megasphaera sp.]
MAELKLVPVKTRILTDKDNIVDAIEEYAKPLVGPDDIVCTAESVVAITQHRYTRPEELTPSWQARLMRRFVPGEGSMASLYGMQAAMELEGEWKMLFCFILGFLAKLIGKNGVWYQLCRQASLTDDVTGTMPPFDKCIVYGPAEPDTVAEKIKQRLGCYGACVADVNDLKRAAVLGHSRGLNPQEIAKILINNPFGNASQKTPIVIIKNYAHFVKGAGK